MATADWARFYHNVAMMVAAGGIAVGLGTGCKRRGYYRHRRKISTSFAESTVNQVISKRMVTLASRSMYTNHCNSTFDKQEREL
jgi:hypothetical protein